MAYTLIKGSEVSAEIYEEIKQKIDFLKSKGVTPGLAAVLVGEDPASQTYVRMKRKKCAELGINSISVDLPEDTSEEDLLEVIRGLNNDPKVHGILVQLPLPKHINEDSVIYAINPKKDVDCFHPENIGHMMIGDPKFLPATAAGIQQLLLRNGIETAGKHVVIVGRSNIVGKPTATLMMQRGECAEAMITVGKPTAAMMMQRGQGADSTVTVVHSKTGNVAEITRQADILIVAMGKPQYITADMVKEGAVVIDAGTSKIADPTSPKGTRLVGDVDFEDVKDKTSAITPVPGGVGPMTICMLMANTVKAAEYAYNDAQKWLQ